MQRNQKKQASILSLFLTIGITVVVIAYIGMSINTTDPLWFLTVFAEIPERIEIDCHGEQVVILPGDTHFDSLTEVVNEVISGDKRWDRVYMSVETYQYYRTAKEVIAIEMFYPERFKIHSIYKWYKNLEHLVIPLVGRHSSRQALFGINNGGPVVGTMILENTTPLLDYVINKRLCTLE